MPPVIEKLLLRGGHRYTLALCADQYSENEAKERNRGVSMKHVRNYLHSITPIGQIEWANACSWAIGRIARDCDE